MFTDQYEITKDVLLQKLVAMEVPKDELEQQVHVCEFCEEQRTDLL
jgi:hypothetical protein